MKQIVLKIIITVLISMCIYILFINLLIYPCTTQGMSMYPTIAPEEIKLTNRWKVITKQELKRGDIVLIEEPDILNVSAEEFDENNILATYKKTFYINPFRERLLKRIIGLSGDHIEITDDHEVYLNGQKFYEEYVKDGYTDKGIYADYMYTDVIVPENSVFVMGDNRTESNDSRSFGCVPIDKIYSVLF